VVRDISELAEKGGILNLLYYYYLRVGKRGKGKERGDYGWWQ